MKLSVNRILADRRMRKRYLETDLFMFAVYYFRFAFSSPSAPFHKLWADDLMSGKNVELIGFRGSAKTFWLCVKIIHSICYRKKRFWCVYGYTKTLAEGILFALITYLSTNTKLIRDFGTLYIPDESEKQKTNKKKATQKKSRPHFITENHVMVKALGIGESPRGLFYTPADESGIFRPDAVAMEDIDVDKSVANIEIIEKNYAWIKGELMGGLDPKAQIFFNGNVIKNDGIVPRFEREYAKNKKWVIRRQPGEIDGVPTWPARYCMEEEEGKFSLKELRNQLGDTSYGQNILLTPYQWGETVIRREWIHWTRDVNWEGSCVVIGVDPAISERSMSDNFAVHVTRQSKDGKRFHHLASYALYGEQKSYEHALDFIARLYREHKAVIVNLESVAFQTILAKLLREKRIAVKEVHPHKDKVTRLQELQHVFQTWGVTFEDQGPGLSDLADELCFFPNVLHDDCTDAMVYAMQKRSVSTYVGSI